MRNVATRKRSILFSYMLKMITSLISELVGAVVIGLGPECGSPSPERIDLLSAIFINC